MMLPERIGWCIPARTCALTADSYAQSARGLEIRAARASSEAPLPGAADRGGGKAEGSSSGLAARTPRRTSIHSGARSASFTGATAITLCAHEKELCVYINGIAGVIFLANLAIRLFKTPFRTHRSHSRISQIKSSIPIGNMKHSA